MTPGARIAVAATWALLGITRLLTLLLPFRAVRRLLGERTGRAPGPPPDAAAVGAPVAGPARDGDRARRIAWLVQAAAARTPWRSDCYPQALTARLLLRVSRVPHTVTFGVRRSAGGSLEAHAWVDAREVAVTGGRGGGYTGVGTFAWAPRR